MTTAMERIVQERFVAMVRLAHKQVSRQMQP